MTELRQYQKNVLWQLREARKEGKEKILIQLETGGGKTVIAGAITQSIVRHMGDQKGTFCLYLVHRKELVDQVVNTLMDMGMGDLIGVIQSGWYVDKVARLQVASVQTLVRRIDEYKDWLNPKVIFVDEAHHIRASTWEKILDAYKSAKLIGLTATPARLDGKGLGKHFEHMIQGPSTEELVAQGHLCNMDCYSIPARIDLSNLKKQGGEYSKKQLNERTNDKFRADVVDAFLKHCMNRRVIHYTSSVADSEKVVERLKEHGIKAAHVDGETPTTKRSAIIEAFGSGDIQVLSNVEIVTEGFDVPACDAIMLSRKTASTVLFRQMVGRGRRPKPDGGRAVLLDLVGNIQEHGHPDMQPVWNLEDGVVQEKTKAEVKKNRTCDACGYSTMILDKDKEWVCPQCNSRVERKTIEDVKMELAEVKAAEEERKKLQSRNMRMEVRKSGGDEQALHEIAVKYGCNPYVVNHWKRVYKDHWLNQERMASMYGR